MQLLLSKEEKSNQYLNKAENKYFLSSFVSLT